MGHRKGGNGEEGQPTERVVILVHEMFQFLSGISRYLFEPSWTLLILFVERVSKEALLCRCHPRSLSQIHFTTVRHKARLSYLSYSSTGRTATSFGPIISVNTPLISDLIVFHCPSKLLAWKLEPEPIDGMWSTLNVHDFPEK
jgi:hypothetical protein